MTIKYNLTRVVGCRNFLEPLLILNELLNIDRLDSYLPRANRLELVQSDVNKTIPRMDRWPQAFKNLFNLEVDLQLADIDCT